MGQFQPDLELMSDLVLTSFTALGHFRMMVT